MRGLEGIDGGYCCQISVNMGSRHRGGERARALFVVDVTDRGARGGNKERSNCSWDYKYRTAYTTGYCKLLLLYV